MFEGQVRLGSQMGSLRARFHRANAVVEEHYQDDGSCVLLLRLPEIDLNKILAAETVARSDLQWLTDAA